MTITELLNTTEHRPWKIPTDNWKFYQEWNDVIFLHYQVELNALKKFVPEELEIDLFDGNPWVSLVAFSMEKIRPKNLPSFPPVSDFHEINIRTYVTSNYKSGVYFLSIEGGKKLSCEIARRISGLPYRFSEMTRTKKSYQSENSEFKDRLEVKFEIGHALKEKDALDHWLTERYALFQDAGDAMNEFEIHHLAWPINDIELKKLDVRYSRFESLINNTPTRAHYSNGVKVLAWGRKHYVQ